MAVAERESLRIRYDGPALESHTMDVRQLAPSLLALAEVFDLAYREASDGYTLPPALEVRATTEGSFVVDLLLAAREGADGLFQWGKTPEGAATGTLVTIATAALAAIRWSVTRRLEHGDLRDTSAAIGRTDDALASAALLGRPAEAAVSELAALIARLLTPASPSAMAP